VAAQKLPEGIGQALLERRFERGNIPRGCRLLTVMMLNVEIINAEEMPQACALPPTESSVGGGTAIKHGNVPSIVTAVPSRGKL